MYVNRQGVLIFCYNDNNIDNKSSNNQPKCSKIRQTSTESNWYEILIKGFTEDGYTKFLVEINGKRHKIDNEIQSAANASVFIGNPWDKQIAFIRNVYQNGK